MIDILDKFIVSERKRFEVKDNNKFTFSFSSIRRYYKFLLIINNRYETASGRFMNNSQQFYKSIAGKSGVMSEEQNILFKEGGELNERLQFEIESFYLFAKILLDRVARAIEFYFGPMRGRSLDSHDDLTKNLKIYCEAKDLEVRDGFFETVVKLKEDIADFRDYEIAHEKSPRTIRGITYDNEGHTKMTLNVIYPKEAELKKGIRRESRLIQELFGDIDNYIRSVINFIEINKSKTMLRLD